VRKYGEEPMVFHKLGKRRLFASSAVLAVAAAGMQSAPALAQDEVEFDEEDAIVVTGTRIKRDGFNEPTPATVFDAETTRDLGIVNAGDIVELIPQNS